MFYGGEYFDLYDVVVVVMRIFDPVIYYFQLNWQGVGTGVLILAISGGKSSHLFVFSEDLFFIYLLPPIIFNAG